MRATLAYTTARILLFVAAVGLFYLAGARGLLLQRDDAQDGEHHRQLVGDQLSGRSQAPHERVLVGRRPAGDEHTEHGH